jgi:DNA polymerase/3'-5' exonuclease PolX
VKDIEIVCIPKIDTQPDLFGSQTLKVNMLESFLSGLLANHAIRMPKKGPRYKKISLIEGICIDLFIVLPPSTWGAIFAIRTGPAEFSHWLVTSKRSGGALPSNLKVKDGALWHGAKKIETPEESDFFKVLGLGYVEPSKRAARWIGAQA